VATFTDGLDGTAGSSLHTRTGWSRPAGADTAVLLASGSGFSLPAGTTTASSTWHAPTAQPSGADQYAEALIRSSSQISFPLGVRCNTASYLGAGYLVRYNGGIQLYRRTVEGGLSLLGSYTVPTPADLTTNPVRLEAIGTAIKVYFKSAAVISVTDANIASGSVAMLTRGGGTGTVVDVDNWQSGEAGTVAITGTGAVTFGALTVAAAGSLAITGTGAVTFGALTAAAAGSSGSTPVGALTAAAAGSSGSTPVGASLVLIGFERSRTMVSDGVTRTLTGFSRERSM